MKTYAITHVTKEDIETLGFNPSKITDKQMQRLAEALGESYMLGNGNFWEDIESFCIEILKLKQN